MKKRILRIVVGAGLFLLPVVSSAQLGETPIMVNTGAMNIGAANATGTTMYVAQSLVLYGDNSAIDMSAAGGKLAIGGSIYQNAAATTNLATGFVPGGNGTVSFVAPPLGFTNSNYRRTIAARSGVDSSTDANATFDRATKYVALPIVELLTTTTTTITADTLDIPSRMGIDAKNIVSSAGAGNPMKMRLLSGVVGSDVYDASLRITGTGLGASSSYVPVGKVIVERDVTGYRLAGTGAGDTQLSLIPFASPFENLVGGYFAGNFVRKVEREANDNVQYVYANKQGPDGYIISRYYLRNATDQFVYNNAYVINLRPVSFDYSTLTANGLPVTGGTLMHNIQTFKFNGDPHPDMTVAPEQLFANDVLYTSPTLSGVAGPINWVIGNSYTAAIDVQKLAAAMNASSLTFRNQMFVFNNEAGASFGYTPVNLEDNFNLIEQDLIPSQSTFVLQLASGTQNGSFSITKDMLSHGTVAHGVARARGNEYTEEILLSVSPKNNSKLRDLTLIGFRDGAANTFDKIDLEKMYNSTDDVFQMYSPLASGKRLAGNALTAGTENAPLSFKAMSTNREYVITASRLESLTTEVVVLQDLTKNVDEAGAFTDLRALGEYEFTSSVSDSPNRFIVHFTEKSVANAKNGINNNTDGLEVAYNGKEVVVTGLIAQDKGSLLVIANAQGRIVANATISEDDVRNLEKFVPVSLVDGVYIANLKGNRSVSKKFVVKPVR